MNSGLECNVEEVFDKFCKLTTDEMTYAVKRALRIGAREIRSKTQSNMTGSFLRRNNHPGKYNDRIEDAAMVGKVKGNFDSDLYIKVHIMGTRDDKSGTFRARFLEKGTQERYNRKGLKKERWTGSVSPMWFFKKAQVQVGTNLDRIYLTEIDKAINKINNTKI